MLNTKYACTIGVICRKNRGEKRVIYSSLLKHMVSPAGRLIQCLRVPLFSKKGREGSRTDRETDKEHKRRQTGM